MKPKKKEKMGKRDGVILLAVALVVGAILGVNAANMELIQKKLKLLNKPAIKTIHVCSLFQFLLATTVKF